MKLLLYILLVVIGIVVYDVLRMYFLFKKTLILERVLPFSRSIPNASFRILVLGDSTAVGTGARGNQDSTAGRLAEKYPNAEVVNLAENGLKIAGLNTILATIDSKEHFDLVLIQIGANDIIRLTSMKNIETGIAKILVRSSMFGGKIILLHSADIGNAKFFPWYVRPLLTSRTMSVRDIYKKIAPQYGATYIDLIDSPVSTKLEQGPHTYYSNDLLHLSGAGYGLWFEEIVRQL